MVDPADGDRIELSSGPIVRTAWRDGVAAEVTISWKRWHDEPEDPPIFDLELRGPFGTTHGRSERLVEALQYARWTADASGWIVAVEGARSETGPAAEQPVGLDGSLLIRVGEQPAVVREVFDETEPAATGPVLDQRPFQDVGSAVSPGRATWVVSRDVRILNPDIRLERGLWQAGLPTAGAGGSDRAEHADFVYTERLSAYGATGSSPQPTTVGEVWRRSRGDDVRVDHALPTAYSGPLSRPLRGFPLAFELGEPASFPALDAALPEADRYALKLRARKPVHLVVVPSAVAVEEVVQRLDAALGRALFDPIVVVESRSLRRSVRRAIRSLGRPTPSVQ